jgi:hypothetical protein
MPITFQSPTPQNPHPWKRPETWLALAAGMVEGVVALYPSSAVLQVTGAASLALVVVVFSWSRR